MEQTNAIKRTEETERTGAIDRVQAHERKEPIDRANVIELTNIRVKLDGKPVLRGIDLTIAKGDFMTFLGPSGCGKTTLLRVIAGLQTLDGGRIAVCGRELACGETGLHVDSSKRGLSLVFQSYALWPHMTVYENVAFGLQVRRLPKANIRERVSTALAKMRIPELAERYPGELSGGQQQRVAIARAIVTEPDILLLDEPLSNLDAKLRMEMRAELKRLHGELNTTIVYVTHDQQEALTLSTKVAVFFGGTIAQVDEPRRLYRRPRTLQVAEFIGHSGLGLNRIDGTLETAGGRPLLRSALGSLPLAGEGWASDGRASDGRLGEGVPDEGRTGEGVRNEGWLSEGRSGHSRTGEGRTSESRAGDNGASAGRSVVAAVKPEDVRLLPGRRPGGIAARVEAVFPAGAETLVQIDASGVKLTARVAEDGPWGVEGAAQGNGDRPIGEDGWPYGIGSAVTALIHPERMNLYDGETGERLESVRPETPRMGGNAS